ncbi:MAG: zinc metallopeptidase [Epsilonproteobacteria bacterium]|nr:zinc metallopeptidase [Campylobacterota bacterium]
MKWKNRRQSSNVDDRRNSSGGGGGFQMPSLQTLFFILPIIKPLLKSKLGLVVIGVGALAYIGGFNPLSLIGMGSSGAKSVVKDQKADDEKAAFIATVLADTEVVWGRVFAEAGYKYQEPKLVLYREQTRSGCGVANSQVGPFYCPADQTIYIDLGFYDELQYKFGASGDFAQAYILAHEVGHHIQNLEGTLNKVERAKQSAYGKADANALQVKVELQADCYAGIWTNHAHKLFGMLEAGDIDEAFNAANSIGDDRLQKQAQGYVQPDAFTHGSSKQRMTWFHNGLKGGKLSSCATFR